MEDRGRNAFSAMNQQDQYIGSGSDAIWGRLTFLQRQQAVKVCAICVELELLAVGDVPSRLICIGGRRAVEAWPRGGVFSDIGGKNRVSNDKRVKGHEKGPEASISSGV